MEPKKCRFYMRGKCRHGIKGTGCKFLHPKPCPKLMKHGTRANGGCAKGNNCTDFHPKMCAMSLTKGECFDPSCDLSMLKEPGAKRTIALILGTNLKMEDTIVLLIIMILNLLLAVHTQDNLKKKKHNLIFLEIIGLLKTEMMEVMDKKINSVLMYQN